MSVEQLDTIAHTYTAGDLAPALPWQLTDDNDVAIDVTGYTFTLRMQRPTTVLTKVAVLTDAVNGRFEFQWDAGDLVQGLAQRCEIEIDDGTAATPETSPNFLIDVKESVD